ncbi:SH2 domain-containing adapter protein E isoform X2 [Phyllopteryx taeniolatus]|uniref:SH2 domain-containing adapter protein E isoform X2 n=1 Tax=Phyllopteryx taeniolatus TaxID=161469 RepID=UPI002AD23C1C|nr:SH2 domain-containing adapter protein E isoform X2 [Phyllopteryx taeniolatus]
MAKWFKDFPINLKNGSERVRSASESGPQTRHKPSFSRDSLKGTLRKDNGVAALLAGRNRKNSATELGRNHNASSAGGTVWETLAPGKNRKSSKVEAPEEKVQVRTTSLAQAYISRMIKVDKQDKTPKLNGISEQTKPDTDSGRSAIKTTLIILEDYADPFDAEKTKEQREAERAGVNDGYMEPYDAQVIITEVRRRGSKDLLKVCVLLDRGQPAGKGEEGKPPPPNIYDTPYEGRLEGDSEGVWIPVTRPESDIRPAAEYELPWEWRKEDIVRALSAQFEAVDCSPVKENGRQQQQQQQTLRQKNWTHKTLVSTSSSSSSSSPSFPSSPILKLSPITTPSPSFPTLRLSPSSSPNKPPSPTSPHAPLDGEAAKVDPSLPLDKQRTSQSCVHIIVAQTKSSKGLGYTLDQSSCVFASIPELVHHYCTHRLPFTGAEHMTLQHAVQRSHL